MNRFVDKTRGCFFHSKAIRLIAVFLFITFTLPPSGEAQQNTLKPGFNRDEFLNLFRASARQVDTPWVNMPTPLPHAYTMTYRSAPMGLENRWDLWEADGSPPVISIRGSSPSQISWMENFFAAMLPAQGSVSIGSSEPLTYCFSKHEMAGVHAGWLIGTVALSNDIFSFMNRSIAAGNTSFYLVGHSQGGAIAFLLNAWIHERIAEGYFPKNLQLKTYCSAAPKPGNQQFAYDFERKNQEGWAYNIINPDDWVPETPTSIQVPTDFSATNPFSDIQHLKKGKKLKERLAIRYIHKKLTSNNLKAMRKYKRILGYKLEKPVRKQLKGLEIPAYLSTSNYMRCGMSIVLNPDADYYSKYPKQAADIFMHHFHEPYRYLAERLPQFTP
jgi:hypothetical protein